MVWVFLANIHTSFSATLFHGEILVCPTSSITFRQIDSLAFSKGHSAHIFLRRWPIYLIDIGHIKIDSLPQSRIVEKYNSIISNYQESPIIEWACPNLPKASFWEYVPDDPHFGGDAGADTIPDQHYLDLIGAPLAWSRERGSKDISIAVISSGVDMDHPDLIANIDTTHGFDFVGGLHGSLEEALNPGSYSHQQDNNPDVHSGSDGWGTPDPSIGNGISDYDTSLKADNSVTLGTMTAGIIAAEIDNALMFAGLSQSNIVPIRTITPEGWGFTSDILAALEHAAINDIDIAYISIATEHDIAIQYGIDSLANTGAVIIASCGDLGRDTLLYPASYSNCLSVGSCTAELDKSSFSNFNDYIDLVAPGGETEWSSTVELIWSTGVASVADSIHGFIPGECRSSASVGTNLSAAMAAGLAALILSCDSTYSAEQVFEILNDNCTDIIHSGWDIFSGHGLLNAGRTITHTSIHQSDPPKMTRLKTYPNPFNSTCVIEASMEKVEIYDINGRFIKILNTNRSTFWDGTDQNGTRLQSGIYFIKIGNNLFSQPILLIR